MVDFMEEETLAMVKTTLSRNALTFADNGQMDNKEQLADLGAVMEETR